MITFIVFFKTHFIDRNLHKITDCYEHSSPYRNKEEKYYNKKSRHLKYQ
jgi:hypothetical protein